jgi:regulator of protease activity HflC (stomatin/prohibitin superfamily)
VKKTSLTQVSISSPGDALEYFNNTDGETVPIVLVPYKRSCCSCCFTVPTGAQTIIESCGEDTNPQQLAEAGFHCTPYWNYVAYMVTPQAITYNAPVKKCPTKDNVMVDCDLSLVIHIGSPSRPTEVKDFIYKLGARRFNEYLSAASDEGIRQLVRDTAFDDVYELRGSGGQDGPDRLLKSLSHDFENYGVQFKRAAITDVHIGQRLIEILQGTTEFSAKIKEAVKEHEHKMKLIRYNHDQELTTKQRYYDRKIQDCQNDQQVALLDREKLSVDAAARKDVRVTQAKEQAAIIKKRAEADYEVVTAKAQQQNETLLGQVNSKAKSEKIGCEQEKKTRIADAQAQLDASRAKANALIQTSKAEGDSAEKLRIVREHKLRMAHMEVAEDVTRNAKIVVSGNTGEKFINSFLDFNPSMK